MSPSIDDTQFSEGQSSNPAVCICYECTQRGRVRESASYLYEIACSITYPTASAYLSVRVTGQNTYRNSTAREVPFTLHERGATTYVELLEGELLEIRVIDFNGLYNKGFYYAHGQEVIEKNVRGVVSTIHRIEGADPETK
ncbi:MAG: hypothetical protein E6J34_10285 [Chloroflexi bacterium]|nr:MAG: hypothetical protein E6J34_10285 [Chloroflexota bacterium]